jgi:hypothetical protein
MKNSSLLLLLLLRAVCLCECRRKACGKITNYQADNYIVLVADEGEKRTQNKRSVTVFVTDRGSRLLIALFAYL